MSWGSYGWPPYVPVAERRVRAAREVAKLSKKLGTNASPVNLEGRKIASTFWGKAWCENLESYSDFENRLPRGRTYVRNGSVVDLQISKGVVTSLVSGSSLYKLSIKIKPLSPALWKSIQNECSGKIDSLIELLQGKLSAGVMQIVTKQQEGLFPTPQEIDMDCSCPDWAGMCKHVAATLYGVGARLDQNPALLFLLRGVDPGDLISQASTAEAVRQTGPNAGDVPAMSDAELADVFGIELPSPSTNPAPLPVVIPSTSQGSKPPAAPPVLKIVKRPAAKKPAQRKNVATQTLPAAATKTKSKTIKPSKSIPEKVLKIVEEIEERGNASLTRLTVLKKWFERSERLSAFAIWMATRAASHKGKTNVAEAKLFRESRTLLAGLDPIRPELDRQAAQAFHNRLRDFQNEHQAQQWASVRIIHNWDLMLVEHGLAIYLWHLGSPTHGYKLAVDYCQNYDPRYGSGLNGPSRKKITEIVRFMSDVETSEDKPK